MVLLMFVSFILGTRPASASLVDPHSDKLYISRHYDRKHLSLVMSDEFTKAGRSFGPGEDELFEAVMKPDNSNEAIQFYNSSDEYVSTKDGHLVITTKAVKTSYVEWDQGKLEPFHRTKNYTSGMIQSWNKFCFTGGVLEIGLQLPGHSDSGGLWPAMWLMGNLARATWQETTLSVWPWSYDTCGEIPDLKTKQKINACDKKPGYGFHPGQGRGAPEIDIFEVMPGHTMPKSGEKVIPAFMSSSLQVSPGVDKSTGRRPINGQKLNNSRIWYENIEMSPGGSFNDGFWGQECGPEHDDTPKRIHKYQQDAISVNTFLNESHFDSNHVYRLEWQPGKDGYLYWYLDDELLMGVQGDSVHSLTGALIPVEPMYLVMNTAISHRWGMPEPCPKDECGACWLCYDCTNPECQCTLPEGMQGCKNLPAEMKVDFIRLYQDTDDPSHTVGCSPDQYPTEDYIKANKRMFRDWRNFPVHYQVVYWAAVWLMRISILGAILGVILYYGRAWFLANRNQYIPLQDDA